MAGPEGIYHPGEIVELSDELARALVRDGYAVIVEEKTIESASLEPVEKAVLPKPKRKK